MLISTCVTVIVGTYCTRYVTWLYTWLRQHIVTELDCHRNCYTPSVCLTKLSMSAAISIVSLIWSWALGTASAHENNNSKGCQWCNELHRRQCQWFHLHGWQLHVKLQLTVIGWWATAAHNARHKATPDICYQSISCRSTPPRTGWQHAGASPWAHDPLCWWK